jgi:CBS-domain-containing membrane protein
MQQWTVREVMTTEVLSVDYDTAAAEVVTTMTTYDVSALAVVDRYDRVLGVITRADLLKGIDVQAPVRRSWAPWRRPGVTPAWTARSAGQMMSAPALTVEPDATLGQAARLMRNREVNRLLVTGPDRRLLGIVTAADLLKVYDRPDEAIRADVREVVATLPTRDLGLDVRDGVAMIAGTVADARIATLIQRLVRDVPGVTALPSEVTVDPPAAPSAVRQRPRPMDGWWATRRPTETADRGPHPRHGADRMRRKKQ